MSVATLEKSLIAKVRPLEDRVLLKRAIEEEKSKGGIIFPDTAKEKPIKGTVMKVGPGKRLESGEIPPMSVKAGDEVLFGKYAGTEVKLEDEEYIVMRESDIIAIIER